MVSKRMKREWKVLRERYGMQLTREKKRNLAEFDRNYRRERGIIESEEETTESEDLKEEKGKEDKEAIEDEGKEEEKKEEEETEHENEDEEGEKGKEEEKQEEEETEDEGKEEKGGKEDEKQEKKKEEETEDEGKEEEKKEEEETEDEDEDEEGEKGKVEEKQEEQETGDEEDEDDEGVNGKEEEKQEEEETEDEDEDEEGEKGKVEEKQEEEETGDEEDEYDEGVNGKEEEKQEEEELEDGDKEDDPEEQKEGENGKTEENDFMLERFDDVVGQVYGDSQYFTANPEEQKEGENGKTEENDFMPERFDDVDSQVYGDSQYFIANRKRASSVYSEVLSSYDELQCRTKGLEEAKQRILRYKPGKWTEKVGGMELKDYIVPKTASLLLVGPERSGKSSLINRISGVFDDDKFSPQRAQVSYNCNDGDGTYFLREYMVLKGSSSCCLYDTRSLSDNESENTNMLKCWMTEGVRHGELVMRNSDGPDLRNKLKCKSQQNLNRSNLTRKVNFVILVVSGLSVLNAMDSGDEADDGYNNMIATMFNCPFLSFKDDKPVVVVTHGDLLSLSDRARVRVHLGELLGIPPKKQIFDIPVAEVCDPATDLTIIDLLHYSLEHADNNFPAKGWFLGKMCTVRQPGSLIMVLILGIAIISALVHSAYVCNGHKLHIPQTDAPIGRNANNAPGADGPGLGTVYAPKADALHVSQTDALTGTNADKFPAQADNPSSMNTKHEGRTNSSCLLQNETTVYPSTTDVPTKDAPTGRNADNFPQEGNPSGMNTKHETRSKLSHLLQNENTIYLSTTDVPAKDAPTCRNADNFPQAGNPSGMNTKRERSTKSSRLPQKETTIYPSTADVTTKDASTVRNANNFPRAGYPSGMNTKHERIAKSPRLTREETTVYPSKAVLSSFPERSDTPD